jgi:hypothetical protein
MYPNASSPPSAVGHRSRSRSVRLEGFHARAWHFSFACGCSCRRRWAWACARRPRKLAGGRESDPHAWARRCPCRQAGRAAEQEQRQGRFGGRGAWAVGGGHGRVLGKEMKRAPWTVDEGDYERSLFLILIRPAHDNKKTSWSAARTVQLQS